MLRYRPEIDGMRAVAVLSVILFHAHAPGFSGGFVGVDVFFVISGYLITSIILGSLENDSYSITSFYERRIRRIFPPLFAMLLLTWLVALFVSLPGELRALSESMLEATLFYSNVGFWADSDYFAPAAEAKPLLHTWSLCVEEQFYLVFPPLLALVARKLPKLLPWFVAACACTSLGFSAATVESDPDSAFYLAHLRAWELLLGSLVALRFLPALIHRGARTVLSLLGLGMIVYAVFAYYPGMSFPGLSALLPTLGASLIIYGEIGSRTWVGSFLAHKSAVSIGLISYALYLWHWPILVLARSIAIRPLTPVQVTLALALTLLLSLASRRWLEEPIRKGIIFPSSARIWQFGGVVMLASCALAMAGTRWKGFPSRLPAAAREVARVGRNPAAALKTLCIPSSAVKVTGMSGTEHCEIGAPDAQKHGFMLWGDSHAQSLAPSVDAAARALGRRGTAITHGGCPPMLGISRAARPGACDRFHSYVQGVLDAAPDEYPTVLLVGRWGSWVEQRRFVGTSRIALKDGNETAEDPETAVRFVERALARTLDYLEKRHKHTIIVGQVPAPDLHVPTVLSRTVWLGLDVEIRPDAREELERQAPFRQVLARLRKRYTFDVIQPYDALCRGGRCSVTRDGRSLYFDDQHLIATSAPLLAPAVQRSLAAGDAAGR